MNLRKVARGRDCTIRLPGCNGGGETTVLAHYRSVRLGAGTAHKPADWLGAWACSSCHDLVDARAFTHQHSKDMVRLAHAEGVLETIGNLMERGIIKC